MSDLVSLVICEVGKPPYLAELTLPQLEKLIGDSIEAIPPAALIANGSDCPQLRNVLCIAGGNARINGNPPPHNRFGILGHFAISGSGGRSLKPERQNEILATIRQYDSEAVFRWFRLPPYAMVAPAWEQRGCKWSPDVHFTGDVHARDEIRFINYLLTKNAEQIVAYHDYRPFPAMFSLEVQFDDSPIGREQARAMLWEYQKGFDSKRRLRKSASATAGKFFEEASA